MGTRMNQIKGHTEFMASLTLNTGAASLTLSDVNVLSTDLAALGDLYRYYRFSAISIEFPAPEWTTAARLAIAYIPSSNVTAVPAFADMEARKIGMISATQTVPYTFRVPTADLKGQVPWFSSQADPTDTQLYAQGTLLLRAQASSAEVIHFKFCIDYEFKELIDASAIAVMFRENLKLQRQSVMDGSEKVEDTEQRCKHPFRSAKDESPYCSLCGERV
jgi:hypothetical protein